MIRKEAIEWAIEEVFHLVVTYSDGSQVWTIYNGVDAWEVLFGYSKDTELLTWLNSLFSSHYEEVYQGFLARWREMCPEPVTKAYLNGRPYDE